MLTQCFKILTTCTINDLFFEQITVSDLPEIFSCYEIRDITFKNSKNAEITVAAIPRNFHILVT